MSNKFETPANDGQSNHSKSDDDVNLRLFSCAFDTPPVSSKNDNSSPSSGLGNLLRMSDYSGANRAPDTTGGVVDKVMNSLGNILNNSPADKGLAGILPSVSIEGSVAPENKSTNRSVPNLSELLNGSGSVDNLIPKPSKPHENGSGTVIDNTVPRPQTKPHESGSGSPVDNTTPLPPSKPHSRPGSGSDNSGTPPHGKAPVESLPPSSGNERSPLPPHNRTPIETAPPSSPNERSPLPPHGRTPIETMPPSRKDDRSSLPPHTRTPIETMPPNGKDDRSSFPPHTRTPIETMPPNSKDDRSSFPPDGRTPIDSLKHERDINKIKQPIDRSSKFKYPENKPLDAEHADQMAEKLSKWIKEGVDKDGNLNLDQSTLDRLKDALQYGVDHGEKGLQEMIAKINKKLEGTGIEIKSDGKAFAQFRTCMPDIERGDHLGDFIGFDIMKDGKKVDSNLVKVGPGVFDRNR